MAYIIQFQNKTVILPSPETGNTENLQIQAVVHRTMSGSLVSYDRQSGKKTYNVSFKEVKDYMVNLLIDLVKASAGKPVTIIDHYGKSFIAKIANNPIDFTSTSEGVLFLRREFVLKLKGV